MNNKLKIGIVGAGAIGGVTASILASKGYDVELATRYKSEINIDNSVALEITGAWGEHTVLVPSVNGIKGFTNKKDIIFVLTQAYDTETAVKEALTFLKPSGVIVCSQNVMNVEAMLKLVGKNKLIALIIDWWSVRHTKVQMQVIKDGPMTIGVFSPEAEKYLPIIKLILEAVTPTSISNNIMGVIFSHLIYNTAVFSIGAICGYNVKKTFEIKFARKLFRMVVAESMEIANKLNVKVENFGNVINYKQFIQKGFKSFWHRYLVFKHLMNQNGRILSPVLKSIEENKRTEIDYLNGYLVKEAKRLNVFAPVIERLYDMIKEIEKGERQPFSENLYDYYLLHPKKYIKNAIKKEF